MNILKLISGLNLYQLELDRWGKQQGRYIQPGKELAKRGSLVVVEGNPSAVVLFWNCQLQFPQSIRVRNKTGAENNFLWVAGRVEGGQEDVCNTHQVYDVARIQQSIGLHCQVYIKRDCNSGTKFSSTTVWRRVIYNIMVKIQSFMSLQHVWIYHSSVTVSFPLPSLPCSPLPPPPPPSF